MSSDVGAQSGAPKVSRLADAVRRVRTSETDRADAAADLHDAEKARLAMLADDLAEVFADLPTDDPFYICRLDAGQPPRLWLDPTTHVVIGRDRRTYRLLKDGRLGRVVLAETADLKAIADTVTDYLAERVVERERALESDHLMSRLAGAALARASGAPLSAPAGAAPPARSGAVWIWGLVAFLFGVTAGILALFAYAWSVGMP